MGTTYQVSVPPGVIDPVTTKAELDNVLIALNLSVSTYIDSSLISLINASRDITKAHRVDSYFIDNFLASKAIYEATNGAFNPAIGPLVEAWGFGSTEPVTLSNPEIDSLRALVNFGAFTLEENTGTLYKSIPGARLDFSAIAKGYGVDLLATYLEEQGVEDYFVEIGGEVRTRGMHPAERPWHLGIDRPEENPSPASRPLQAIIPISNHAVATSGNYRNFYVRDGVKYVHTINPETGYPEVSSLLSVSVLAPTCTDADGFATAFMVMGVDKALALVQQTESLEAYFIIADSSGAFQEMYSEGFPKKLATE